jgi:hypothetical protein
MAKAKQTAISMMAASRFYRVLLERVFQSDNAVDDIAVPKTTILLSDRHQNTHPDAS